MINGHTMDEPMTTLDADLLAYSMDELQAMGRNSQMLLGARVARELETHPQPDVLRMLELRRQMELTQFHPALVSAGRSRSGLGLNWYLRWISTLRFSSRCDASFMKQLVRLRNLLACHKDSPRSQ